VYGIKYIEKQACKEEINAVPGSSTVQAIFKNKNCTNQ